MAKRIPKRPKIILKADIIDSGKGDREAVLRLTAYNHGGPATIKMVAYTVEGKTQIEKYLLPAFELPLKLATGRAVEIRLEFFGFLGEGIDDIFVMDERDREWPMADEEFNRLVSLYRESYSTANEDSKSRRKRRSRRS